MSEADSTESKGAAYDKGDRAAILSGKSGIGVRGEVFWIGENKYGSGMRYGLRGDDGATYWVDEADLGPEDKAPPAPERPKTAGPSGPVLQRGDSAEIISGPHAGKVGEIFWAGDSKYGEGMRYGIRGDGEDAYWVDSAQVRKADSGAATGAAEDGLPLADDGAPPADDALPPEAYEDAGQLPPEAYEGGGAIDDDDLPF